MVVYFDASPSPHTTIAVVFCNNDQCNEYIKDIDVEMTNNQAEYLSLIYALSLLSSFGVQDEVIVRGDSQLVINQMKGVYRVKNEKLKPLYKIAKICLSNFKNVEFQWVPREKNLAGRLLEKR